jgi:hypothetical protein
VATGIMDVAKGQTTPSLGNAQHNRERQRECTLVSKSRLDVFANTSLPATGFLREKSVLPSIQGPTRFLKNSHAEQVK